MRSLDDSFPSHTTKPSDLAAERIDCPPKTRKEEAGVEAKQAMQKIDSCESGGCLFISVAVLRSPVVCSAFKLSTAWISMLSEDRTADATRTVTRGARSCRSARGPRLELRCGSSDTRMCEVETQGYAVGTEAQKQ